MPGISTGGQLLLIRSLCRPRHLGPCRRASKLSKLQAGSQKCAGLNAVSCPCPAHMIQLDARLPLGSRSGRHPPAFLLQSSFHDDSPNRVPGVHQ